MLELSKSTPYLLLRALYCVNDLWNHYSYNNQQIKQIVYCNINDKYTIITEKDIYPNCNGAKVVFSIDWLT